MNYKTFLIFLLSINYFSQAEENEVENNEETVTEMAEETAEETAEEKAEETAEEAAEGTTEIADESLRRYEKNEEEMDNLDQIGNHTMMGEIERKVLASIAQAGVSQKDDNPSLKGILDDLDNKGEPGPGEDDNGDTESVNFSTDDLLGSAEVTVANVDTSSLIVQRLGNNANITVYFAFEDPPLLSPLFKRTSEDFGVDFIIFVNPAFPKGSGHYVVLRRLDTQTEMVNYAAEDEIAEHEKEADEPDFDDEEEDSKFDRKENGVKIDVADLEEEENDKKYKTINADNQGVNANQDSWEEENLDPRTLYSNQYNKTLGSSINKARQQSQQGDYEVPGVFQSGEEDDPNQSPDDYYNLDETDDEKYYQTNGGNNEDYYGNDYSPNMPLADNETLVFGRKAQAFSKDADVLLQWRKTLPGTTQIENDNNTEIIYESFLIKFKSSLHGFVSNLDPLHFSFQTRGDPAGVLDAEDDDDEDFDRMAGDREDDDDDDSYVMDLTPVDTFRDGSFYELAEFDNRKNKRRFTLSEMDEKDDYQRMKKAQMFGRSKRSTEQARSSFIPELNEIIKLEQCVQPVDKKMLEKWRKLSKLT